MAHLHSAFRLKLWKTVLVFRLRLAIGPVQAHPTAHDIFPSASNVVNPRYWVSRVFELLKMIGSGPLGRLSTSP